MASLKKSSKHIVLVPFPAQGHIPPMLYLARKLALQGFVITIINIDSIHEVVKSTWKPIPEQEIRLESIPLEVKFPAGITLSELRVSMDYIEALEDRLVELLTRLNTEVGDIKCVVSDYVHPSAPFSAHKTGFTSVCFWSGAATWAAIEFNLGKLIDHGHCPVEETNADQMITYLPGLEQIKAEELPIYLWYEFYTKDYRDGKCAHRPRRLEFEPLVLVNSFYEMEAEVFDAVDQSIAGKFVSIGPLFPQKNHDKNEIQVSLQPEDADALRFLDKHAPNSVLYVAFGSTSILTFEEFKQLTDGLEASDCLFLLVIPQNLVTDLPQDYLKEFMERNREKGLVVTWAAQLAVLQHNSVGGFVTHCGWNSILESLSGGVPMLGWPRDSDQHTNCTLILERKGIGMGITRTKEGIAEAIRGLMGSEDGIKMRRNAEELGKLASRAAAEGGSSYENLKTFYKEYAR